MPVEFKMFIDEQRQRLTVELHENSAPICHFVVEAPELEQLIEALANARASLSEQVPLEIDPGTRTLLIQDPAWRVGRFEGLEPAGSKSLSLRHPGYGWLCFAIPEEGTVEMAKWLAASA